MTCGIGGIEERSAGYFPAKAAQAAGRQVRRRQNSAAANVIRGGSGDDGEGAAGIGVVVNVYIRYINQRRYALKS